MTPHRHTHKLYLAMLTLCAVLVGCSSAPIAPPVETIDPQAAITISGDIYSNAYFSARLPDGFPLGWRVITSPADEASPFVTFASADSCEILVLAVREIEAPPASAACTDQDQETLMQTVALSESVSVYVAGRAPSAGWEIFTRTFEMLVASIALPAS